MKCEDKKKKVVSDIIKVTDKEVRENRPIFTINIYRTTSNFLVNGTQVQKFIQKVISMMQWWVQYNQVATEVIDKKIEQVLRNTASRNRGKILSSSSRKEQNRRHKWREPEVRFQNTKYWKNRLHKIRKRRWKWHTGEWSKTKGGRKEKKEKNEKGGKGDNNKQ